MLKPNIVKIIAIFTLILLSIGSGSVMAQTPTDIGTMANPGTGTDQNGQSVNIQINTPLEEATVPIPLGQVDVTGQAVVGTETFNTPGFAINVLYVVDVSSSTDSPPGQDCDGNGVDGNGERYVVGGDNFNGDFTIGDTLDCEISGLLTLNNYLATLSGINTGIVVFGSNGAVADVNPSGGDDPFTTPTADNNNNGIRDIEEVARSIDQGRVNEFVLKRTGTGTYFPDALDVIPPVMANRTGTKMVFFLTDGANENGGDVTDVLQPIKDADIPVNTYSIGENAEPCEPGKDIQTIADETGGQCVKVEDPTRLGEKIVGTTPVEKVEVTLNGGTPVVANIDVFGFWSLNDPMQGVVPGANTIQATAFTKDGTTVVADIIVYGEVGTITLTPESDTNPINSDHTITLMVEDAQGNPLANQTIDITVSGANSETTNVTTDSNGQATFTYTGANAGTDTITASTDIGGNTVTAQATKTWLPVTISLTPETAQNPIGSQHTVTALVQDTEDNPLANQALEITVTGVNPISQTVNTDSEGRATFSYTGANAGTDTIVATMTISGSSSITSNQVTKTWLPVTISLTPETAENPIGSQHTVTALVQDSEGNPLANQALEITVTGVNPSSQTVNTDSDGQATFSYTGIDTGTDTIVATMTISGSSSITSNQVTKTWLPVTISLTPETAENPIGSQHTVTALVQDSEGNPLANQALEFTVTGVNPSNQTVNTDSDGQATFSYTGINAGTDTIVATTTINGSSISSNQVTKIWVQTGTISLTPETAQNPVDTEHTVTALVEDTLGNPFANQAVEFTVTGVNPSSQTVNTDANGEAIFSYTGINTGTDTIVATTTINGSSVTSNQVTKIWVQPEFTQITLLSFTAAADDDQVTLVWETASELDNEGFNIWRSTSPDGGFAKINVGLIAAQGDELTGANYSFVDPTVEAGTTYYYQLEDIDFNGVTTLHQVVSVNLTTADEFEPVEPPTSFDEDEMFKPNEE